MGSVFCIQCGVELVDIANFCSGCGKSTSPIVEKTSLHQKLNPATITPKVITDKNIHQGFSWKIVLINKASFSLSGLPASLGKQKALTK